MAKKNTKALTPFNPSKDKISAVLKKHGYLYPPHHGYKDWPALGADCGDGWAHILDMTLTELEELDTKGIWKKSGARIDQIKEKYGTLQIYASAPNEEGLDRLHRAEIFSALTCERCGNVGVPRERGWILTLCPSCTDTDKVSRRSFYLYDRTKKTKKMNKAYAVVSIMGYDDFEKFKKWQEEQYEKEENEQ